MSCSQVYSRLRHYLYNFKYIPPVPPVSTVFVYRSSSLLNPTAPMLAVVHFHTPLSALYPLHTSSPYRHFRWMCAPSFYTLGLHRGPCKPLGGSPVSGPSVSSVPQPRPSWVLLQILAYYGYWYLCQVAFCARSRGQGSSTPCQSLSLVLAPPPTWPCHICLGYLYPPPPFPSSPCRCYPIPAVRRRWGIALEVGCMRAVIFHGRGVSVCKKRPPGSLVL